MASYYEPTIEERIQERCTWDWHVFWRDPHPVDLCQCAIWTWEIWEPMTSQRLLHDLRKEVAQWGNLSI